MKKVYIYIGIAAVLALASCNRVNNPDFPEGNGNLQFKLQTSDMVTRATEPGDDTYNENTIETIDWFFFRDAEGTEIILADRLGTKGTALTDPTLEFDTSDAQFADLKKTFYAYFLVNYPGTFDKDTMTFAKLLDLPVGPTDFTAATKPVFVMDSYEKADANGLILMKAASKEEDRTQTVSLTRISAKLVLNINVAKTVAGNGDEVWTPELDQFQAYFVNALNTATVAGTPVVRTGSSFIVGSNEYNDKAKYFSYSNKHPWTNNGDTVDELADSLTTNPFYTYPQAFQRSANGEPYFKIALPWTSTKKGTNSFYYKVLVPGLDTLKRNSFYHVNLDLDVIGGTTDDYVVASHNYFVAEWFSPGNMEQTGISSARFLDIAQDTIKFYNQDTMAVAVTSSHAISASITSASKYDFKNNLTVSVSTSDYSIVSYGKNTFTVKHNLDREISHKTTFDCSPITFQVRVIHTDNGQQKDETVTVIQYPPIYIEQETSNGYVFANGDGNSQWYQEGCYNNSNQSLGGFASRNSINDTGGNTNPRQYTVYVSVLPDNSGYVIGDPRATAGGVANLGDDISTKYRRTATNTQNILAPAFKMASSYGKTNDLKFERAEERCAAYQENGYPAGRWRVPTVAEIEYVISLYEYSHIPELYKTGRASGYTNNYRIYDTYWAGGMYAYAGSVYNSDTGRGVAESLTNNNLDRDPVYTKRINNRDYYYTSAVRCVYDVWYWGDNPLNNQGEQVAKDGARATQWLGYDHMD